MNTSWKILYILYQFFSSDLEMVNNRRFGNRQSFISNFFSNYRKVLKSARSVMIPNKYRFHKGHFVENYIFEDKYHLFTTERKWNSLLTHSDANQWAVRKYIFLPKRRYLSFIPFNICFSFFFLFVLI